MTTTTNRRTSSDVQPNAHAGAFTVQYRQLLEGLKVTAVAAKVKSVPILSRVLIESDRRGVRLTTFDFDTAITVELETSDRLPGRMLLEHAAFSRVLAAAVKGVSKRHVDTLEVRIDVVDGMPTVHVDGYSVPFDSAITADQFPDRPVTTPPTHVVRREAFVSLFNRCRAAADRGDTRPILTAVRVDLGTDHIGATATDRYRLATGSVPASGTSCEEVLAPAATVGAVLDLSDGDELALGTDAVEGTVWLTIQTGRVTARVRTLDGTYPSTARVVDAAGGSLTVTLSRVALAAAAGRAAAITSATVGKDRPSVWVIVDGTSVTIEPGSTTGRACTAPSLPAMVVGHSERWVAGVDPTRFLEAVSSIDTDQVALHLGDPERALVLTAAGEPNSSGASFRHLLMPVRLPR